MKSTRSNILYIEPKRVADWDDVMLESSQLFTPRTWALRLLAAIFKEENPCEIQIKIMRGHIKQYPELAKEIKEHYPALFN